MQTVTYKTKGTCSKSIIFERDEQNRIHNIKFEGGCDGNLKAISKLCEGMTAEEISAKLLGNLCREKEQVAQTSWQKPSWKNKIDGKVKKNGL